MNENVLLYKKYFQDTGFERVGLFSLLKNEYCGVKAIYPGSFVHIAPAFIYEDTVFIDSDRRVSNFFSDKSVIDMVNTRKEYSSDSSTKAFQQNYSKKLPEPIGSFDLLISQYAGFVSQECKNYLKLGGILVVNNSHGDAGLAYLDDDYKLIAVANHTKDRWRLSKDVLDEYFIPKKGNHPSKADIYKTMKGVGYKKVAANYVFRKVS